jgi:hypothetical protein
MARLELSHTEGIFPTSVKAELSGAVWWALYRKNEREMLN